MMTSCEPALPRAPPDAAHIIRLHIYVPTMPTAGLILRFALIFS